MHSDNQLHVYMCPIGERHCYTKEVPHTTGYRHSARHDCYGKHKLSLKLSLMVYNML
jgi:hypothetical protein